jgi:hypothetical protein
MVEAMERNPGGGDRASLAAEVLEALKKGEKVGLAVLLFLLRD